MDSGAQQHQSLLERVYPLHREAVPWQSVPFERYQAILVTGPQRSGTTWVACALASSLGYTLYDERHPITGGNDTLVSLSRALADPAVDVRPRPGWRYRCTLVYRAGLGQAAFFRALRLGPRLAAMMGTVCVDVEEVRAARLASTVVEDASHRDDEASDAAAFGAGNAVEGSSDRTGDVAEPEREEDGLDAEESYDFVGGPCRRATLAEFYTLIRPAMHRIGVDSTPAAARAARAARAPRPPAIASDADTRMDDDADDDSVCAICMDGTLEVVTRCGHAYCEECYLRWLSISRECPLCRDPLGVDMRGSNVGSYAMVGPGDLLERQASGGRVDGRGGRDDDDDGDENAHHDSDGTPAARMDAEWLRGRLGDLPVVAEADARRARFAAMFARLKRAEEAERG